MEHEFVIENGVLTKYNGPGGEVVIPEGVTKIGKTAFEGCKGLTGVTIPTGVTEIGVAAFFGCTGLTSVTIPAGVTEIGQSAFYGCTGLTSVTIPESVTKIGVTAFKGCMGLTGVTIPESVTGIGGHAFSGCTGLISVTISESVTEIGEGIFSGCTGLRHIEIAPENMQFSIKNGLMISEREHCVIFGMGSLISVTIPESVTRIGGHAFSGCTGLISVTIPESVTEIGWYAFEGCTGLTSVTILGKPEIERGVLPDSVVSIVAEQLRMSDYPTPPYKRAAVRGFTLRYGSGEALPEDYRSDCLKYIKGQKKKLYPEALADPALLHVMLAEQIIPKGDLHDLMEQAVTRNKPEVTAMLLDYQDKLLKPEERKKLEEKKMQREMDFMLAGSLTVTEAKKSWKYEKDEAGNLTILGYKGKETEVVVPAIIGKDRVTAIGDYAFSPRAFRLTETQREQRRQIRSITLPETITEIGGAAFKECTGLTSVTIPEGVTEIGWGTFYGCKGLTSITIPNCVTWIGESTFEGCTGLTSITIPNRVTKIYREAFSGCTGLTSIIIPNRVTKIGESAFSGCGLTSITIPSRVTKIGESVFASCGLTSITIPNRVTKIGGWAFSDCRDLTSVSIPAGVTEIGEFAFFNCPHLTIHAPAGSYAEQYAREHNIRFEAE